MHIVIHVKPNSIELYRCVILRGNVMLELYYPINSFISQNYDRVALNYFANIVTLKSHISSFFTSDGVILCMFWHIRCVKRGNSF